MIGTPPEILEYIAAYLLPDKGDVRSFTLVHPCTVSPGRHVLFEGCCTNIHGDEFSIARFTEVLHGDSNIGQYIRSLVLNAIDEEGTPVTLRDMTDIVSYIPGLTSLHLIGFLWTPSVAPVHPMHRSNKLSKLRLEFIACTTGAHSPLALLSLANKWTQVDVMHLSVRSRPAVVTGGPFAVENISLAWSPFWASWNLGIRDYSKTFVGLKRFRIQDIVDEQTGMIRRILEVAAPTLQKASLELTTAFKEVDDKTASAEARRMILAVLTWEAFGRHLRAKVNLIAVTVTVRQPDGQLADWSGAEETAVKDRLCFLPVISGTPSQ
ncbi:hypothetical protein EIP86_001644 [Pleurotus ostreatoroseus]|nr:hypothetical protein EIP86_001644 [Pleurotus ostreatoroseus]